MACVGVVIKDTHGNISLAHVSTLTDFNFIREEIDVIQNRNKHLPYTITLYRNTHEGKIPLSYKPEIVQLLENYLTRNNFSYTIQPIPYRSLIVHEDGQITPLSLNQESRFVSQNKLVFFSKATVQKDTYETQLLSYLSKEPLKPLLIYDQGDFTKERRVLSDDIKTYVLQKGSETADKVSRFYMSKTQKKIDRDTLNSLTHIIPRYRNILRLSRLNAYNENIAIKSLGIFSKPSVLEEVNKEIHFLKNPAAGM